MIRALRIRHRWMIVIIALATAAVFALALLRRQAPRTQPLPPALRPHADSP
jgi:hypothetical protein